MVELWGAASTQDSDRVQIAMTLIVLVYQREKHVSHIVRVASGRRVLVANPIQIQQELMVPVDVGVMKQVKFKEMTCYNRI